MSGVGSTLSSVASGGITQAEARQVMAAANGDRLEVMRALEAKGVSHAEAINLANHIAYVAHETAPQAVIQVNFTSPTVASDARVSIAGPEGRARLIRSAPQTSGIAGSRGPSICGGAAMANAIVLSSDTPARAQANATAIRDTVLGLQKPDGSRMTLTPAQEHALAGLYNGEMTPADLQELQVLLQDVGRLMYSTAPSDPGLDGRGMSGLLLTLREHGAFRGANVAFHNVSQNLDGQAFSGHWTCTVNGVHANSDPTAKRPAVGGASPDFGSCTTVVDLHNGGVRTTYGSGEGADYQIKQYTLTPSNPPENGLYYLRNTINNGVTGAVSNPKDVPA